MANKKASVDSNEQVVTESVDEAVVANVNKTAAKKVQTKKFGPSDAIQCRSVTYGELILEGYKSRLLYTWANAGDITSVEYQDLQALYSRKSQFLTDPLFIIEDKDLVEQWSNVLKPVYDKIEEDDVDEILNLPINELQSRLKVLPNGLIEAVKNAAVAKILNGELDSLNKIRAIDEVLDTELINMIV